MSVRLTGIPAAPGVALAAVWRHVAIGGDRLVVSLDVACGRAAAELEILAERLRIDGHLDEAAILDAQALMATDEALLDDARQRAAAGAPVAEAVRRAGAAAADALAGLDDELLAARAADIRDVAERIARIVTGAETPCLERRSIVVAEDLPPSVTAELDRRLLAGIAVEAGSRTAHAAILARALGIPAVVGVKGLLAALSDVECVAIDGDSGEVLIAPDDADRAMIEGRIDAAGERAAQDRRLVHQPLQTRDGTRVMLGANIGQPDEARMALDAGAEGIGLFRTEFMFMGRREAPDVATQTAAYAQVFEAFDDRPVVVRLIDLGGDKQLPYLSLEPEANPFLGVRALRLAERDPDLIVGQLRAILDAAEQTGQQAWIMGPMIADLADVYRLHELVALAAFGRPVSRSPKVGVMIEVPSAVTLADRIAPEVAFMSIGTNDLTQYLLAADRTNPAMAARQDPMHPAVLRSMATVVEAGRVADVPVAVCGEMAGDPIGALALVGLGVDELSMDQAAFAGVKRALAQVSRDAARDAVRRAMVADRVEEARALVAELLEAG